MYIEDLPYENIDFANIGICNILANKLLIVWLVFNTYFSSMLAISMQCVDQLLRHLPRKSNSNTLGLRRQSTKWIQVLYIWMENRNTSRKIAKLKKNRGKCENKNIKIEENENTKTLNRGKCEHKKHLIEENVNTKNT